MSTSERIDIYKNLLILLCKKYLLNSDHLYTLLFESKIDHRHPNLVNLFPECINLNASL